MARSLRSVTLLRSPVTDVKAMTNAELGAVLDEMREQVRVIDARSREVVAEIERRRTLAASAIANIEKRR